MLTAWARAFGYGALAGIIIGWALRENRREIHAALTPERCGYMFPWSGQCKLPNHHPGEHH